jgi:hypothetical protein
MTGLVPDLLLTMIWIHIHMPNMLWPLSLSLSPPPLSPSPSPSLSPIPFLFPSLSLLKCSHKCYYLLINEVLTFSYYIIVFTFWQKEDCLTQVPVRAWSNWRKGTCRLPASVKLDKKKSHMTNTALVWRITQTIKGFCAY